MRQQVIEHLEKLQRMRQAQSLQVKSPSKENYIASKQLEMEIDIETARIIALLKN